MTEVAPPANWYEGTGKLCIDWTALIGHPCQLDISCWQRGLQAQSMADGEPQPMPLSDIGDWLLDLNDDAIRRWRATIPEPVLAIVNQLPDHRVAIIELVARSTAGEDLFIANPKLFWLLVDARVMHTRDVDAAANVLKLKQRDLLKLLGLSGTAQQVKILRKTRDTLLTRHQILKLRLLLSDAVICSYFSHERDITATQIDVLDEYPWLAACPAKALIDCLDDRQNRRWFNDTLRMLNDLDALRRCTTRDALMRLHDRLVEQLNNRRMTEALIRDRYGNVAAVPEPPLPGNGQITPLTTQEAVVQEGMQMHHCIGSYLARVVEGRYAVYHIELPERLTIGVNIKNNGSVVLDDIRGKRNAQPSDAAQELIESWFTRASSNISRQ